jgi:hypothetical protein
LTKKKEHAMKSTLLKNAFSEKAADEIWKWYTSPPLVRVKKKDKLDGIPDV